MVTLFYFVVFALALVMTGSFLYKNKNINTVFILFSILVTINCLGRYMLASSQSLEMAIWANKFLYVGGCYAPLLTVMVLAKLCNLKMSNILFYIMTVYSTVVMCLVLTIGKSGIYYKEVALGHGNGYNYLIKTYGPLHFLYPVMMLIYAGMIGGYLIYAIKGKKTISFRTILTISGTGFAVIFMYILERVTGSHISFLAVGYLVGIALLIKYFERVNMYDISTNVAASMEKLKKYGYIVFDDRYRYISSNSYIKELFPEINSWIVDAKVPESETGLYKEVVEYLMEQNDADGSKIIPVGENFFQIHIRQISYGKKACIGYMVDFIDRTLEKKYYNTIEEYNVSLEKQVSEKTAHILHIKDMMVLGMADMVESRDSNTGGHIKRTSGVIKVFSDKLKSYSDKLHIDEAFLQQIVKAAPMHDLGKIAIDDAVLRKPGKYTEEEYTEMKRHTVEGARIVENILRGVEEDDFVQIAKNIAHFHHEKWNGQGYPLGLSKTEIPIEARIMALADVFDALVSKRCYKEAFSYDEAFNIIQDSLGEHFDPELGKIFLECRTELEAFYNNYI